MEVGLVVDHDPPSCMPEAVDNAKVAQETSDALVVNVHANYVLHGADRFSDHALPQIFQMHAQFEAAREAGSTRPITPEDILSERPRPFRSRLRRRVADAEEDMVAPGSRQDRSR